MKLCCQSLFELNTLFVLCLLGKPSRFPCVSKISCFGNHQRGSLYCLFKCAGYLFLSVNGLGFTRGTIWQKVKSVLNFSIFGNEFLFSRFPITLHWCISAGPFSLLYKLKNDYLDYVSNQSFLNFNHQTLLKCTRNSNSLPEFRNTTWHFSTPEFPFPCL